MSLSGRSPLAFIWNWIPIYLGFFWTIQADLAMGKPQTAVFLEDKRSAAQAAVKKRKIPGEGPGEG